MCKPHPRADRESVGEEGGAAMKKPSCRLTIQSFLIIAATNVFAANYWTWYGANQDSDLLDHSSGWCLHASANSYDLTVTGVLSYSSTIPPPLADGVIGGYRIVSIGPNAFSMCGLTRVTIPNNVTIVGAQAFAECTSLTNVVIGDGVTRIRPYAFYGCTALTDVVIGKGVPDLGMNNGDPALGDAVNGYEFFRCNRLANVVIGSGVTYIGGCTFNGCYKLKSMTIPDNVTRVYNTAFYQSGMTNFSVAASHPTFSSIDGVLIRKDTAALTAYPSARFGDYMIPDGVTRIGEYAFYGCSGLTGVTIPDGVTNIADAAFSTCGSLREVKISESVTRIGTDAFSYGGLTSITIPDGVTDIGVQAFSSCQLTNVVIGSGVISILGGAFEHCAWLGQVLFRGSYPGNVGTNLYQYTPVGMTSYVLSEHASSWDSHVNNGPIAGGNAVWQGRPIRILWPSQPPLISTRSPAGNSAAVVEGASVAFSVTANDSTDPDILGRGMSNITWYVDGVQQMVTWGGVSNAVMSAFTFKTATNTVRGVAFLDVQVMAVAMDKQGCTTETNWTVRVNNIPTAQIITFPALPVKVIGDPDFATGAQVSSLLPIVYSNSNPAVVQVIDGVIHVVGAGTAVITATQPGNFDFTAAAPVKQTLTVKARLTTEISGNGSVTASPSSLWLYAPGTKVILTAKPAPGNTFLRWEDGSQMPVRSLVMPNANRAVSAWFNITTNVPKPVITNPGAQSVMVGVPFRLALQVASECLPAVTMTGLPAGLKFDAGSRTIGGVPTAVPVGGGVMAKISASNPGGKAADVQFKITVAPLAAKAQGTFTGIAVEPGANADTVKGLFTMTVTPVGAISAKVTGQANAISFTGKSWDTLSNGVFQALLRTVKGEALAMALDTGVAWNAAGLQGTLTGGVFGASARAVWGQRNAFLVKTAPDYATATNTLAGYKGYYTVALHPGDVSDTGAAGNEPQGSGYLALTVKDGGAVTLAGKLADGTALSGSATLLVPGLSAYVPLLFPLYSARGVFSGLIQLAPAEGTAPSNNVAVPAETVVQVWHYPGRMPAAIPPQTEDRFALTLGMSGGYYNSLADLRAHYSNAWFSAQEPGVNSTYSSGAYTTTVGVVQGALPEVELAFNPGTGAISLPLGKAPGYSAGAYVYAPTNPAAATLTVTPATGLFGGKFNLYYEYLDQAGALKLKTVPITHAGVLTPMRLDDAMSYGQGFYLVPDTWKSTGVPAFSYPLYRSYEVEVKFEER